MASMKTVCVIGLWHLGSVNAVGFAEQGYKVIGLDFDEELIGKLNEGIPPLFEPGLEEAVKKHSQKKIREREADIYD